MRGTIYMLILLMVSSLIHAQGQSADFFRSTGKIYSVVAVIVLIFIGIVIYLWTIDKKLSKLEKHIKDE